MTTLNWKTSTRSNEGNCVEVATPTPMVMVRDSKDREGPVLSFGAGQWAGFVRGIKGGRFTV
ncbi:MULTISPECIES: DUF397 domain-containing protein [Micromonospora]|uniref:DUF397 domain-containing protein n=1 Tax=Micromonospora TaxID=1873 RepID=UPI001EE844F6|nr:MULTISPECIES: DUF397 domain-containing protein [Micromonospora]MCG5450592.1 DUF397 domain-containing protein [Micromonospora hortensis]MCX5117176.1 DUF397 domain-containing protein [Micromonospora sp. NBC_00362]